jgi:hypothetical protein
VHQSIPGGAEARRLADPGTTTIRVLREEGTGRYAVAMETLEDNEFDIS